MIWGLNLPGTPRATSACRGITLFYFYYSTHICPMVPTAKLGYFPAQNQGICFFKLWRSVLTGQKELNPGLTLVLKGFENVNVHWSFKSSGMWQCVVEWVEWSCCQLQGQAVHEDPEDEGTAIRRNFGNYPKRGRFIPQELIFHLHCSEILTSRTNVYCILIMKIIRKKLPAFIEYTVSMSCS